MKKYAIGAVVGFESCTWGATEVHPSASIPQMYDTELGLPYEVAFIGEFPDWESAHEAAREHYTGGKD